MKNKITELNDLLRDTFITGRVILTEGFRDLDEKIKQELITQIREYKDFNEDNDPYGEHDFGVVQYDRVKVFWKIDYYDNNFEYLSEDPASARLTKRVLTIMLAEEY